MYIELAGTTAESIATYLAAHPENKLPLLLEIKEQNTNGINAKASATIAVNNAQANIDQSLMLFKYVHDAIGLGITPLTFIANDGFQLVSTVGTTSSTLQVIPIQVTAGSED